MDYSKFSNDTLKKLANNEKLDYSKLSDDELRELANDESASAALPTDEDKFSTGESLARGVAQGASFGFADEATALGESLLTDKKYEDALAESRANYAGAEEEDPYTTLAGNLIGGVAIPGIGAGKAGLNLVSHAGKMAATGAIGGALTGLGQSDKSLVKDTSGVLADTAEGAIGGAAAGAILAGITNIGGKAVKAAKGTQFVKDLKDSIKYGLDDVNLLGNKADIEDELRDITKHLTGALKSERKLTQGDYTQLYNAIREYTEANGSKLANANDMMDAVKQLEKGTITNKEAAELLKTAIGDVTGYSTLNVVDEIPVDVKNTLADKQAKAIEQGTKKLDTQRLSILKQIEDLDTQIASASEDDIPVLKVYKSMQEKRLANIDNDVKALADEASGRTGVAASITKPSVVHTDDGSLITPGTNIVAPVSNAPSELKTKQVKSVTEWLADPTLTPEKAQKLKTALSPLLRDETINKSPQAKQLLESLLDQTNAARSGNVPGIGSSINRLDSIYKAQSELSDLLNIKDFSDLNDPKSRVQIINGLMKKFVNSAEQGKAGIDFRTFEEELVPKMEDVFGKPQADEIMNEAKEAAKKYRLSAQLTGEQGLTSDPQTLFIQARGIPLAMAHEGALGIKFVKNISNSVSKYSNQIITALGGDPQKLSSIASRVGGSTGRMMEYIASQPEGRRKTLLFAAMQQPAFREALSPELGSDDE